MTERRGGEVLVYQRDDGTPEIEVRLVDDTVWVTQAQLVELFDSSKATISEHLRNIYAEGELTTEATVREFRTVRVEGSREVERSLTHYNLDAIISVGILEAFIGREDVHHIANPAANNAIGENRNNPSVSSYVAQADTRDVINIVELNVGIARIVARQQELRAWTDEIAADLEGADL